MDFIVVEGSPVVVLIIEQTMEALMVTLDYVTRTVTLKHDSKVSVLDWLFAFDRLTAHQLMKEVEETDSEDLTS